MRSESFFGGAIFAMAALGFAALPATAPPTVKVSSGTLEGTYFGDSPKDVAFLGVPYAAPPVGELRWKPPVPTAKWTGVRKPKRMARCARSNRKAGYLISKDKKTACI